MNFDNSISNTLINIIFERITITENPKALLIINKNNIKIKTTLAKWLLEFLGIPRIFVGIPRNLFLGIPRNS